MAPLPVPQYLIIAHMQTITSTMYHVSSNTSNWANKPSKNKNLECILGSLKFFPINLFEVEIPKREN